MYRRTMRIFNVLLGLSLSITVFFIALPATIAVIKDIINPEILDETYFDPNHENFDYSATYNKEPGDRRFSVGVSIFFLFLINIGVFVGLIFVPIICELMDNIMIDVFKIRRF